MYIQEHETPLHKAAKIGHDDVIEELIIQHGAKVDALDKVHRVLSRGAGSIPFNFSTEIKI